MRIIITNHFSLITVLNGAEGSRTPDLLNAIQAFSQLNYRPSWRPLILSAAGFLSNGVFAFAGGFTTPFYRFTFSL